MLQGASIAEFRAIQAAKLASIIAQAVNCVVSYFEGELRMEVSASESVITSSMPAVAQLTETLIRDSKAKAGKDRCMQVLVS